MRDDPTFFIMRSPLGRARGLGSAKSGTHHWLTQRISSVALLPLSLYFVISVLILEHAPRVQVAAYIGKPWNTALFLLLIFAMFHHLLLGMQVVIEDYIHSDVPKVGTLLFVKGIVVFCGLASAVAVLKLAL